MTVWKQINMRVTVEAREAWIEYLESHELEQNALGEAWCEYLAAGGRMPAKVEARAREIRKERMRPERYRPS